MMFPIPINKRWTSPINTEAKLYKQATTIISSQKIRKFKVAHKPYMPGLKTSFRHQISSPWAEPLLRTPFHHVKHVETHQLLLSWEHKYGQGCCQTQSSIPLGRKDMPGQSWGRRDWEAVGQMWSNGCTQLQAKVHTLAPALSTSHKHSN